MPLFENKVLLITGGTGSFGHAVLDRFLTTDIREIRILSRDEKKQDDMRHAYQLACPACAEKIKFYIGDVRDYRSIAPAFRGVDYVFHAAALKQVPSCEFFPMEPSRPMSSAPTTSSTLCGKPREKGDLSLHRQGRLSHQRHGHVQSYDGKERHRPVEADAGRRSRALPDALW